MTARRRLLATAVIGGVLSGVVAASPLARPQAATTPAVPTPVCHTVTDLAGSGFGAQEPTDGTHQLCSYTSPEGLTRTYWVFHPKGWTAASQWPMVVVLHGCTEQGPDIAAISRFSTEAAQQHFTVVYPNQAAFATTGTTTFDGNGSRCWNWFLPQGQSRGAGEPTLIAGITQVQATVDHADRHRIDVIGISAGGAMADIMAATYPDLYAAAGVLAGCEYRGLPCLGSLSAVPPQLSAQWAHTAAGSTARSVPFIVENGDVDPVVPLGNALLVVQQFQVMNDLARHHGRASFTVPPAPCATSTTLPASPVGSVGGLPTANNPVTIAHYDVSAAPCPGASVTSAAEEGELWVVHGELHAWPGGPSPSTTELYSNPGGPDFTHAAWLFFQHHPCRVRHGVCVPSR